MSDIVERLRDVAMEKHQAAWGRIDGGQDLSIGAMLADEAADEIERLEAELREAREVIRPFADEVWSRVSYRGMTDEDPKFTSSSADGLVGITLGDFRRARAFLAK